jgi:hypothetical protein
VFATCVPTEDANMRISWILLLSMVLAAPSFTQSPDDAKRCYESAQSNPDLALHYCAAAIQSGRLSEADLAITLANRGNRLRNQG